MKRYICLLLVLVMMMTLLSGCGAKKKLLGVWETKLDISPLVGQMLADAQLGGDHTVTGFEITGRLEFFKDNTFILQLDPDTLSMALDKLLTELEQGLLDLLQSQLQEQGLSLPIGDLLTSSDLTPGDLTDRLRQHLEQKDFSGSLYQQSSLQGFYRLKGDKLLFCGDEETKLDDTFLRYTLEANTLSFTEAVGENAFIADNLLLGATPITFTKVK